MIFRPFHSGWHIFNSTNFRHKLFLISKKFVPILIFILIWSCMPRISRGKMQIKNSDMNLSYSFNYINAEYIDNFKISDIEEFSLLSGEKTIIFIYAHYPQTSLITDTNKFYHFMIILSNIYNNDSFSLKSESVVCIYGYQRSLGVSLDINPELEGWLYISKTNNKTIEGRLYFHCNYILTQGLYNEPIKKINNKINGTVSFKAVKMNEKNIGQKLTFFTDALKLYKISPFTDKIKQ